MKDTRKYIIGVEHSQGKEEGYLDMIRRHSVSRDKVGIELGQNIIDIYNQSLSSILRSNGGAAMTRLMQDLEIFDTTHYFWMNLMRESMLQQQGVRFIGLDNPALVNKGWEFYKKAIKIKNGRLKASDKEKKKIIDGVVKNYLIERENYFAERIEETNPRIVLVGGFHIDYLINRFPEYHLLERPHIFGEELPKEFEERYRQLRSVR